MAMRAELVNCPLLDPFETPCTGHLFQATAHPVMDHAVDLRRETDNILQHVNGNLIILWSLHLSH